MVFSSDYVDGLRNDFFNVPKSFKTSVTLEDIVDKWCSKKLNGEYIFVNDSHFIRSSIILMDSVLSLIDNNKIQSFDEFRREFVAFVRSR